MAMLLKVKIAEALKAAATWSEAYAGEVRGQRESDAQIIFHGVSEVQVRSSRLGLSSAWES
jgi:hypothetical protein